MLKKLRSYTWLLAGIIKRYRNVILVSFLGALIVFVLAVRVSPFVINLFNREKIVIGLVGAYTPSNLPLSVQKLISSGLTVIDESGKASGALATSWEVSPDGREYIFHLQPNIYWHDGGQFEASDVNYNLKDVKFQAIDKNTLKVTLNEPFAPLPGFLAKPLFKKGLVGVGSYKLKSIKLKGDIVIYLSLLPVRDGQAEIIFKFYPSELMAKTAFKLGEISSVEDISDPTPLSQWKSLSVTETVQNTHYVAVFFNLENDFLKTKEVRQALAFALDKPEKNRIATPLSRTSWAYTTRVRQYDQDIAQAKKLLLGVKLPQAPLVLSTIDIYLSLAQIIAAQWESVGVATKVKVIDALPDDYQALLTTQEVQLDPDQYPLWHSTQKLTNITRYSNPKIDKLLEDGRKEQDQDKRQKIYFDFQRYLVEDAPAIFMFHPTTYTISRK